MNKSSLILVIFILTIVLGIRFFFFYRNQPQYKDGQYLNLKTTLLSEPQLLSRYQKFSANLASGEKIFITTAINPQFHYGNSVRIFGPVRLLPRAGGFQPRTPEERANGASTLNAPVLNNKKIVMSMYFPKIEAAENDKNVINFFGKNILAIASFIRQKIIFLFEKTLSPTLASLLLGIVFGVKESMPSEFMNNLRIAGVLHVVAASGMNVTIVGGFLASIFTLFLRRQIAIAVSILGILFYATLAGLEPSIIRASIMGILVFSAQILGRQTLAWYGLVLAGFFMLFVSPNLISDVGFQLSFVATLGLLFIKPVIERKESAKNILEKSLIGEDLVTTLTAQTATLPILLANFGTYSLWSVVVNGLVLWTIPILMIIGGAGAIVGIMFFPIGQFIIYLSLPLLLYFEKIVNVFAALPGVFRIDSFPWQITVGYYMFLLSLMLFLNKSFADRKEKTY